MTIELDGLDGLRRNLEDIQTSISGMDYSEQLRETAADLRGLHQGYFDSESDPDGNLWPDWHLKRRRASWNHKNLDDTGRLKESLISEGGENIEIIDQNSLEWGTGVPYSRSHQDGESVAISETLIGRRGQIRPAGSVIQLPVRQHVGITTDAVDRIAERIAEAAESFMADRLSQN